MTDRSKERFIAFAFARADVLFEIDAAGKVGFVAGAAKGLFGVTIPLTGASFPGFVPPEHAAVRQQILDCAAKGTRLGITPIELAIASRRVAGDIAGCPLPDHPGTYFLSFRAFSDAELRARAEPAAEPSAIAASSPIDSFTASATRLAAADKDGKLNLSLVGIDRGAEKPEAIASPQREAIRESVAAMLRSFSADEKGVAQLAPDRFGLVHDSKIGSDLIREKIGALLKTVSPQLDCGVNTLKLRPAELTEEDVARALVFAINKFANQSDGSFTIESLAEVLETRFQAAVAQVAEFRSMVSTKAFELWYQPIVDIRNGTIHHQEALCRFADGRSPFTTVVFAEEAGLITDLDYYVAERAVETLLHVPGALDIAINVSGRSFETPLFLAHLEVLLERLEGSRHRLLLEITESSRINDLTRVNTAVERFRRLGHKVCIDDFGSGAAAFDYLRALNVDIVKIDGKFIRDLPKSPRDQTFVRAIQAMCSQLKCGTIAEMVEGAEHAAVLKEIGIEHAQGYFYAKPAKTLGMRGAAGGAKPQLKIA